MILFESGASLQHVLLPDPSRRLFRTVCLNAPRDISCVNSISFIVIFDSGFTRSYTGCLGDDRASCGSRTRTTPAKRERPSGGTAWW
mmetsp:Transcript_10227/g.20581  ORF Transcript_10227/g.20581 Transcript_10227/m.20581 type:complete len:87 (+) Transcript_10227:84-344(+)